MKTENVTQIARQYLARGWAPVPIPHGEKGPVIAGWEKLTITPDNVENHFINGTTQNIGVMLGPKSNGLTDVDLDCSEAVRLAPYFLPATEAVFGRASKACSHYLYKVSDPEPLTVQKYLDDNKSTIIELRLGAKSAVQTIMPPSQHPSGELVAWVKYGEPKAVSFTPLSRAVRGLAFASLLMRHWPIHGGAHDVALRVGGFLARAGQPVEHIGQLVEIVAREAGDTVTSHHGRTAMDAAESFAEGKHVYGLPALRERFGEKVANALAKIMNYGAAAIRVNPGDLPRVVDQAEAALLEADYGLYQRGISVVRAAWSKLKAADNKDTYAHLLVPVNATHLVETLTKVAAFEKWDGRNKKYVPIDCPEKIANTYLARVGHWQLPVLAGVINAPCLRHDGSVLSKPGYDPLSGLLFEPNGVEFPPVPDNPTKQQAQDALKILKHLLREFPFVADADRSVALSGILTALDRRAMAQAPMHGSTAPVIASGKTLLWNIATLIATGQEVAVVAQGWDDEELEKRLGAALLAGQGSISIDNCVRPVGGDFLNTVLTSPRVKLRPLGTSQEIEVPTNATMFCNGNNITFKADFTRRVLLSTIDPKLERPESRKFQSDPKAEIDRRRGEFVIAALTVLRAYHVAKPNIDLTPFASYEDYNYRIIGPLLWLGEASPRDTARKIIAEDPERQEIKAVMQGWWAVCKDNRRRAFEIISSAGATEAADTGDFYNVLRDIAPHERGGLNAKRLGNWLRKHKGRIVNGMKFVEDGESHLGVWWKLEKVAPSEDDDNPPEQPPVDVPF
jgi:hypothetical protein